jgi:stage II sporulation protein AA (anti-sigma F factor antagonist)
MNFQARQEGSTVVVTLSGRLDAVTAPEFEQKIRDQINVGVAGIVIDFAELDYISSAGLRALLVMAKLLKEKNGRVCMANVTGNVRSVFEMSGFTSLFKMQDSVAAAVAAIG